MDLILNELLQALVSILVILLGIFGTYLGQKFKIILNTKEKKQIVKLSVEFVEQVSHVLGLNAEEKFELAKERALELMNENGIKITELELNTMIEAFVFNLSNSFKGE